MEQLLLARDGQKVIVKSQRYKSENELQEVIKTNPDLINLTSIFETPILIVGRESQHIDVLALTSDAVPVVIECKRKDNPDMRYLIAQIFEYASKLEKMTYYEFDRMATDYFAGDRCEEAQYRGLTLKQAFLTFRKGIKDFEESYDEDELAETLAENLKAGEFYLVIVVDEISESAFQTIDFLNRKLDKLRVEVIEITKFSDKETRIYVPHHANEEVKKPKPAPGKTTFEEMLADCDAKEAEAVRSIKENWEEYPDFTIIMGTKGFSARYKDIPILYVLPSHFRIAPRVVREYKKPFETMMQLLEKHFVRNLKVGVSFSSSGFNLGSIAQFIESVKALWQKGNLQLG
jgi:hypothetical protein